MSFASTIGPVALVFGAVFGSVPPARAQTIPPHPVTTTVPVRRAAPVAIKKAAINTTSSAPIHFQNTFVAINPTTPLLRSLLISTDGRNWAKNLQVEYRNPCRGTSPPSGCPGYPPSMPIYLHWNGPLAMVPPMPPIEKHGQFLDASGKVQDSFYYVMNQGGDSSGNCWDPRIMSPVLGPWTTSDWHGKVISANHNTTFTCRYYLTVLEASPPGNTPPVLSTDTVTVTVYSTNWP